MTEQEQTDLAMIRHRAEMGQAFTLEEGRFVIRLLDETIISREDAAIRANRLQKDRDTDSLMLSDYRKDLPGHDLGYREGVQDAAETAATEVSGCENPCCVEAMQRAAAHIRELTRPSWDLPSQL
jgi:hypothetical protein